jgi:hypothetical protein
VTEHHRRAHDKLADGAVRVIVHVAAADPDRMDGDAHVVRPQLFGDLDIAESEFVFPFKDKSFHFYASKSIRSSKGHEACRRWFCWHCNCLTAGLVPLHLVTADYFILCV